MPDCDRIVLAKSFCSPHYYRMIKYGCPTSGKPVGKYQTRPSHKKIPVKDRLLSKIKKSNGCWVWQGAVVDENADYLYGQMKVNGVPRRVHRLSYVEHKGKIPPDYDVHHSCRNTLCINPNHLEALSRPEHNRRSLESKGT